MAALVGIRDDAFLSDLARTYAEWVTNAIDEGASETLEDFPAGPLRAAIGRELIRLLIKGDEKKWDGLRARPVVALTHLAPMELMNDIEALLNHKDRFVRGHVCPLVAHLGIDTAMPRLMEMFEKERDEFIRTKAALALGKMHCEPALPLMISALQKRRKYIMFSTVEALLAYGGPEALEALATAIEKSWVRMPDPKPDLSLVSTDERTKRLIGLLLNGRRTERWLAADLLGALRVVAATEALIDALGDESEYVRQKACFSLTEIGARDAIPTLVSLLDDPVNDVRREACDALTGIEARDAVPTLIRLLEDPESDVRRAAAKGLGKLEAKEALEPLVALLRRRNTMFEVVSVDCAEAADALAELGMMEAIKPLKKALKDERFFVRSTVAEALGRLEARQALRSLKKMLEDDELGVAASAARALGKLGARDAAPAINEVFKKCTGGQREGYFETLWLLSSAPRRRDSRT
jgi:HEAT repeat protein